MASKKIFVGSLPHGIDVSTLKTAFEAYGQVDDVFVKPNCEPTRQWAFITYSTPEEAQRAKEGADRSLTFPGSDKPVDVMPAKNQGMFGQDPGPRATLASVGSSAPAGAPPEGPKKIFVGSLPDDITDETLRNEFSKYGTVTDIFLKTGCETGRQWAFISFPSHAEANAAKTNTDRTLTLPGASKACEVTLARNQGMFGQGNDGNSHASMASTVPTLGPKKIFVGSLPDHIDETILRTAFETYGQITDVFIKTGCETGRQWGFITFATPEQAVHAKDSCDRVLTIPGAEKACEVMLAKNQGKGGQDPKAGMPAPVAMPGMPFYGAPTAFGQLPMVPMAPAPAHLSPWRCYYTATGLPYYHNHTTGQTTWEAPAELAYAQQQAAGANYAAAAAAAAQAAAWQAMGQVRYAPY